MSRLGLELTLQGCWPLKRRWSRWCYIPKRCRLVSLRFYARSRENRHRRSWHTRYIWTWIGMFLQWKMRGIWVQRVQKRKPARGSIEGIGGWLYQQAFLIYLYTPALRLRCYQKAGKFFDVSFLNFHIYFVSEQGNRFGAKVISLGYLGYLNF